MIRQVSNQISAQSKRLACLAASFSMLLVNAGPALAADIQLKNPTNRPAVRQIPTNVSFQPDLLLVMPDAKADGDEVNSRSLTCTVQ